MAAAVPNCRAYDPAFATPNSIQQLHSYMVLGWETGIRNQFRVLHRLGFTRAQIMEIGVEFEI